MFLISKTCWALISTPKILRDTQKDCGEPDCPNDHRSQVFSRGDEVIEQSGDFRFWHFSDLKGLADDARC